MARKSGGGSLMTRGEQVAGSVFFLVYLLLLPLTFRHLMALVETLLGISLSAAAENAIYYYLLFAVTLLLFHRYLWKTSRRFFDHLGLTFSTVGLGLVAFYGCNELIYRLTHLFWGNSVNLNDVSIAAQVSAAPRMTALIVVFLAPLVEEVLFRGLVFDSLRTQSRAAAYAVSTLLFAFLHVWRFLLSGWDFTYLILMLQYLAPGIIFAWAYEHAGTLWGSALLHMLTNALSLWVMAG